MRAVLNIIALICVAIWAYGYFTGAGELPTHAIGDGLGFKGQHFNHR